MVYVEKWDLRFLKKALEVSTWSKDPSTKVGACIVRPRRGLSNDLTTVSEGFNGFPRKLIDDSKLIEDRQEKYRRTIHAEINAILVATEMLDNYWLYSTQVPCCNCAPIIIQAGLSRVVALEGDESFNQRHDTAWSISLMEEAGIEVDLVHPDAINSNS